MKGYLLDTSVLSLFAPDRPAVSSEFARWMDSEGEAGRLYIPAIAVAEIKRGILKLVRRGGTQRGERLEHWLQGLIGMFADRILSVDVAVSLSAADIEDAAEAKGRHPGFADVLIAATAAAHDLTLVTSNIKHFKPLGVSAMTPIEGARS